MDTSSSSLVVAEIVILVVMLVLLVAFAVYVKVKGDSTYEQDRIELDKLEKEFDAVDEDMKDVLVEDTNLQHAVAAVWQETPLQPGGNVTGILQDIITESQKDTDTLKSLLTSFDGKENK